MNGYDIQVHINATNLTLYSADTLEIICEMPILIKSNSKWFSLPVFETLV